MTVNQKILDQTITATGSSGGWVALPTTTMLQVMVDLSAGGGTPTLDIWLESSPDGTNGPFEVPADLILESSAAAGTGTMTSTPRRDIIDNKTSTTSVKAAAIYKHIPAGYYRLAWTLTGAGATFAAKCWIQGK